MGYRDPHGDEPEIAARRWEERQARAEHDEERWHEQRYQQIPEPICPHTIPLDLDMAHDAASDRLIGF